MESGSVPVELGETCLEVTDDRAESARGEEPWPERTRRVLTDRWKSSQRDAKPCRHVLELPADLVFDGLWPVRIRKAGGVGGISGRTLRVRAHVADGDGLAGGSSSGHCGGSLHITSADATDKPTANLLRSFQFSPGERASPGDEGSRAAIIWSLSLEQR